MLPKVHPATLTAAASVLAQAMPEYGDPQRLLAALRLADQAKDNPDAAIPPGPRMVTLAESARRLCVCRRTLQNWVASGKLPSKKLGGKFVRVLEADLTDFMQRMPARPVTAECRYREGGK